MYYFRPERNEERLLRRMKSKGDEQSYFKQYGYIRFDFASGSAGQNAPTSFSEEFSF
jgi:hypothetical protein